jgi:hypothetical protein
VKVLQENETITEQRSQARGSLQNRSKFTIILKCQRGHDKQEWILHRTESFPSVDAGMANRGGSSYAIPDAMQCRMPMSAASSNLSPFLSFFLSTSRRQPFAQYSSTSIFGTPACNVQRCEGVSHAIARKSQPPSANTHAHTHTHTHTHTRHDTTHAAGSAPTRRDGTVHLDHIWVSHAPGDDTLLKQWYHVTLFLSSLHRYLLTGGVPHRHQQSASQSSQSVVKRVAGLVSAQDSSVLTNGARAT